MLVATCAPQVADLLGPSLFYDRGGGGLLANSAPQVADFGVPLCATIHISGSVITITTCSIAVMLLSPNLSLPDFPQMMQFLLMLGLIMIAAPGIPGGGVMAALGVLASMLGFDETALGLMIALYIAQDSFGTAANVTGDGAILTMVNKWMD